MRCRKVISCLNAYADGELAQKRRRTVKDHLAVCETCRNRLEDIHGLERALKDTFHVPPVPDGFAARVLNEARRRRRPKPAPERRFSPMVWNPFRWIAEFSAPMRVATCVTILLAVVVGWSLDGGQLTKGGMSSETKGNLYGVEWFDPSPPGSISSIYITMTTQAYEQGNGK